MNKCKWSIFAGLCAFAMFTLCTVPVNAQSEAVKAKAPVYTYVANWQIPRTHWAEMRKDDGSNAVFAKALEDGTISGYGFDENMVHSADGWTHDNWWTANSMAGLIKVLEALYEAGGANSPALESATKHYDLVMVSRYYNWKPGTYKNAIVQVSSYKLKENAPDDAYTSVCSEVVAPLLEKMLADGIIVEYEIDTEAVHTSAPGTFMIVTVSAHPEDVDKLNASIQAVLKEHPLEGVAFGAVTSSKAHHDELALGIATFK
ncbi:MAG: hypothetical protein KGN79_03290 [Acidobacteriota bacterium]|nr:hypothetical protein [Acidobacteriota bacterium]